MRFLQRLTAAGALVWLATAAGAATVEVTVRDGDGRPLADERVRLVTLQIDAPAGPDPRRRRSFAIGGSEGLSDVTGAEGRVRFPGVEPGTYRVELAPAPGSPWVAAGEAPTVTVLDPAETLRLELVAERGVTVRATVRTSENEPHGFNVRFRETTSDRSLFRPLPPSLGHVEETLPPGLWQVTVAPPGGQLLVGLERDGRPLPGSAVRLDLEREPRSTHLTWTYAAPCRIEGQVAAENGDPAGLEIAVELVSPGPWLERARERDGGVGSGRVGRFEVLVDREGRFETAAPDGRWRLRPDDPRVESSEPEEVDLELEPGETGQALFRVRLRDESGGIQVSVRGRGGEAVEGAEVALFPEGDPDAPPLATGVTRERGAAVLPAPEERGDFLVVAAAVDYLEGASDVFEHLPGDPRKSHATVVLDRGAEVALAAADADGGPLAGARVELERLDEAPPVRLKDGDAAAAKSLRTLVTDRSGRARARGLYPGAYALRALDAGPKRSGWLLLDRGDGEGVRRLDVDLDAGERLRVSAHEEPAASLAATVVCGDGWTLPETAAVRVLDAAAASPSVESEDAVLTLDAQPFERGRLAAGPLAPGLYHLALRPAGFDRWSFYPGTYAPSESAPIAVESAGREPVDLGFVEIECGPAVDLAPRVASGDPFPDLDEVEVEARILALDEDRETAPHPDVSHDGERILLRGLPRGRQRLAFSLAHPWFLPAERLHWQVPIELERGQHWRLDAEVAGLGGAVEVTGSGEAAALYGPAEDPREHEAELEDGRALFSSLAPGVYRLELYRRAGQPPRVWEDLVVRPGETLHVRGDR